MNRNLKKIVLSALLCSSFVVTGCNKKTATENDNVEKTTDIIETKKEKPEAKPIVLDKNPYNSYAEVLDNILSTNGICDATMINEDSGLVYADLLDLSGDGNDELFVTYINKPATNGIYTVEIWGIENEKAIPLYTEEHNGTGLVNDRTVMLTSKGTENYLCYSTNYMSGREPDPYSIVQFTDFVFYKIDGANLTELEHITKRNESTPLGEERVVFKCYDENIAEDEFNSKFNQYTSASNIEIIKGNAGSPYWETTYDSITANVKDIYSRINDELPEEVAAFNHNEVIDLLNNGAETFFKVEESAMLYSHDIVHDTNYITMMDGYVEHDQWEDKMNAYFINGSKISTYLKDKYLQIMKSVNKDEHPLNTQVMKNVKYNNVIKTKYDSSNDIISMKVLAKYLYGHSEFDDTYHDVSLKLESGTLKIVDLYSYKSRYSDEKAK